jgi:peptidoglycan/LPS O-acetylase OafA/YrhL
MVTEARGFESSRRMQRLPALDGLRAIAILCVVASHVVSQKIPGGFGVTLFFFISGFIITRGLLKDDALRPFYIRRAFRLMPALVVLVAVSCLTQPIVYSDVAASLLYFANYHRFEMSLDQTWSLAVEEHFYFLFPVAVLLLPRRRLHMVLLVIIATAPFWRLLLIGLGEEARIHRATDTRIDSIAYGCLLSVMFARESCKPVLDALSSRWALVCGALVLVACFVVRNETFRESFRYSLQGLAFMPLFCALNQFGFFLTPSLNPYVGFVLVALPCTLASYYLVETPMRRLGTRHAAQATPRVAAFQA